MEPAELELFERSLRHATSTTSGGALDAALEELGWADALTTDRRAAVSLLFECQGAANATSSALDLLLGAELAPDGFAGTIVLPALGPAEAPGELCGDRCAVRGLATAAVSRCERALVVTETAETHVALSLPVAALSLRRIEGIDPWLGLVEVSAGVPLADALQLGQVDWVSAIAVGQLALGHELVGAGRAMLDMARRHALERVQFGRPIASFQAVRHRLADSLVAVEAADALIAVAWDEPTAANVSMAKSVAGRGCRTVARHCQQVLAGMGFTAEHPFHRFVRRSLVLDELLGSGPVLTRRLGNELLATRTLPPAVQL